MNQHEHPAGRAGDGSDDELRARLRGVDPAASLAPADPDRVARLLEDTMDDQLTDESRSDGTHRRSPLTWLVAAAAVVVIAGGVAFVVADGDDDAAQVADGGSTADVPSSTAPTSDPGDTDPGDSATVTELGFDDAALGGRCAVPTPEVVGGQELAFDGVVRSITGDVVTLEPTRFFTGDETDLVTVRAPSAEMQQLLVAVDFEEGQRYLVSATDDQVTLCGITAAYSDDLETTYEQAFAG